jgi:hypothetical protein
LRVEGVRGEIWRGADVDGIGIGIGIGIAIGIAIAIAIEIGGFLPDARLRHDHAHPNPQRRRLEA